MLALVLALALGQCTKDTDCKGERVCADGACVEPLEPRAVSFEESERRVQIDRLTSELIDLRTDLATSPYGPLGPMLGGLLLGGLAGLLGYLFSTRGDPTYAYLLLPCSIGALALFLGGGLRLGLNVSQRDRLPGEIANREARLRELGVEADGSQPRPTALSDQIARQLAAKTGCPRQHINPESSGPGVIRFAVCQARYVCSTDGDAGMECMLVVADPMIARLAAESGCAPQNIVAAPSLAAAPGMAEYLVCQERYVCSAAEDGGVLCRH